MSARGYGEGDGDCQGTRSIFLCLRDTASRDENVGTKVAEVESRKRGPLDKGNPIESCDSVL